MVGESSSRGPSSWVSLRNSLPVRNREPERRRRRSSATRNTSGGVPEIRLTIAAKADEYSEDEDEDDEVPVISIGIDLGTTYSGVAWAQSTRPTEIDIVRSWDSDLTRNYDNHKVPSVLTYDRKSGKVTSWGYNLRERKHHVSWFKLLLSRQGTQMLERHRPEQARKLKALLEDYGKTPVDVAADYLRCLWNHASREIVKKIGIDMWKIQNLRIVLTVPAIWDFEAQQLTRSAAKLAGLLDRPGTTLELVGEPEAAALSVFDEMTLEKRRLKVGDPFIVCDAGGGTVEDLISYTIDGLKSLKLAMCNEARGDLCGGIFIDAGFEKHIREVMMTEDEYTSIKTAARREMMNDWEFGVKRQVRVNMPQREILFVRLRGFSGRETPVPRPTSPMSLAPSSQFSESDISGLESNIDQGSLPLRVEDLQSIFNEQCSKIKKLVYEQVEGVRKEEQKLPKAILLVGGFGQNEYLREDLVRSFPTIEIQQPMNAWAAICRGAVLKGLGNEIVLNHVLNYNYGTLFIEDYEKGRHLPIDKEYDEDHGINVAKNQMDWFVYKGDNIEKNKPVTHEFHFRVKDEEELKLKTFQIYYSSTPKHLAEKRKQPSVLPLCTLFMSFSPSIFPTLPIQTTSKGETYRELAFELEMQITSGEICWSTRYKGVETGSVRSVIGAEGRTVDDALDYRTL